MFHHVFRNCIFVDIDQMQYLDLGKRVKSLFHTVACGPRTAKTLKKTTKPIVTYELFRTDRLAVIVHTLLTTLLPVIVDALQEIKWIFSFLCLHMFLVVVFFVLLFLLSL